MVMSQIGQAPPPIHHNDHSHLSFNSSHLHLIGTQSPSALLKHTPHSSQLSDLAYTKWTLSASCCYLPDTLLIVYLPPVLSIVCPPPSIIEPLLHHHPGVCAAPRHPRVPGKTISLSVYPFTSHQVSKSLLASILCLPSAESINTLHCLIILCLIYFCNR